MLRDATDNVDRIRRQGGLPARLAHALVEDSEDVDAALIGLEENVECSFACL